MQIKSPSMGETKEMPPRMPCKHEQDILITLRSARANGRPRSSIINEMDRGGEFESKKWVKKRESRESEERKQRSNYYLRDSYGYFFTDNH